MPQSSKDNRGGKTHSAKSDKSGSSNKAKAKGEKQQGSQKGEKKTTPH